MSKLNEYFAPKTLGYPGGAALAVQSYGCGGRGDGVIDRLFAPAELPYPTLPITTTPTPAPLPSGTPSADEIIRIVRVTIENPAVAASLAADYRFEIVR